MNAAYKYNNLPIMVEIIDNEPWFIAKDVCDALGLNQPSRAIATLDEDELTLLKVRAGGQIREVNAVNESGLYGLIFKSRKPEAKAFKRWVTHEVLPSIRKTGTYHIDTGPVSKEYWTTNRIANAIGIQPATLFAWLETHGMVDRKGSDFLPSEKAATKYAGTFAVSTWVRHCIRWTPSMSRLIMQRYRDFATNEPRLLEGGVR